LHFIDYYKMIDENELFLWLRVIIVNKIKLTIYVARLIIYADFPLILHELWLFILNLLLLYWKYQL
jgi:hypothetical protein